MKLSNVGYVLAALLLAPLSVHGQEHATDRGSFQVGGFTAISMNQAGQSGWSTSATFQPQVEFFVREGLALGGSINLGHSRNDAGSYTSYGVGPAATYYFAPGTQSLIPYISATGSRQWFTSGHGSAWGFGGGAGVLYMLNPAVGLNTGLYYSGTTRSASPDDSARFTSIGLSIGVDAFVF